MIMPSKSNQSILILDSNVHETAMLAEWFRKNGFTVEVVTDSLRALSHVRIIEYRLVLINMDLNGDLGGFETIWLMKTIVDGAKIALIGETISQEHIDKAKMHGVNHWIHKPFNNHSTLAEIKKVLSDSEMDGKPNTWIRLSNIFGHRIKPSSKEAI